MRRTPEDVLDAVSALVLEGGTLPLEDALKRYEEGVSALRKCMAILKQAEARVQILAEQNGELVEKPFDETKAESEERGKLF